MRRQHRSRRLRSRLASSISGLIHGLGGLLTTVVVVIDTCLSRMLVRVDDNWLASSEAEEAGSV